MSNNIGFDTPLFSIIPLSPPLITSHPPPAMNPIEIINKYYTPGSQLWNLLTQHSRSVAEKALRCAEHNHCNVDKNFVYEAAMLHDIGIFRCNAPSIFCNGTLPYICHGIEGRKILDAENLPLHALVCERHTGAGLTAAEIARQNLPLPRRDMIPQSSEERLICYADKFFSKSKHPLREKSLQKVIREMSRFGKDSLTRFLKLHLEFGE